MAGCSESGQSQQTNSRVAQLAAEALEDLFLNTFLPSDPSWQLQRPLYLYEGGLPLQKKRSQDVVAADFMLWRFEEMVRDKYQNFLRQYFGHTLRDGVEQQKIKRCDQRQFTRTVPEGESLVSNDCQQAG
jgi:hypothetical protein